MLNSIWNFLYKYFPDNHIIRTNYFKMNGNVFYIVDDETGKKTYFPKIKGLVVTFLAKNSTLIIHSNPLPEFVNTTIKINADNNFFEIQSSKYSIRYASIYSASQNAKLYIGKNIYWGSGKIILGREANADLKIGDFCLFSTGIYIRTSDAHTMYDLETQKPLNPPKNVVLEDNIWLNEGVKILKGTYLSEYTVVGAGTIVNKPFTKKNIAIAGIPAKIIKENIGWSRIPYDEYCEKNNFELEQPEVENL